MWQWGKGANRLRLPKIPGFVRVNGVRSSRATLRVSNTRIPEELVIQNTAEPFHSIVTRHDGEGKSLIVCGFPNRRQL